MSNELVIAVDVDEVCADLLSEWILRYNRYWDDDLKLEDITDWDMSTQVKPECGEAIYEILDEEDLYDFVLPLRGALSAVKELRKYGRVVFVSARNGTAKLRWLQQHGFLPKGRDAAKDFIMASDKNLIQASILFDDHVENVARFDSTFRVGVLVTHPHNKNTPTELTRVDGLMMAPEWMAINHFRKVR